jgi:hypothetical protein
MNVMASANIKRGGVVKYSKYCISDVKNCIEVYPPGLCFARPPLFAGGGKRSLTPPSPKERGNTFKILSFGEDLGEAILRSREGRSAERSRGE